MKKFIITEEEKNHIKGLYEQVSVGELGQYISKNKSNNLSDVRAKFITIVNNSSNWIYEPNHYMKEFAFIPKKGDLGFEGFKQDSFSNYVGKPLVFKSKDGDTNYCYLDTHGNIVLKTSIGKKTLPLSGGDGTISQLKSLL